MPAVAAEASLLEALTRAVGAAAVSTDPTRLAFLAHDVYGRGDLPLAVVRPPTIDALAAAARVCSEARVAIVPRGGGLSYTAGYLHEGTPAVLFDLAGLDRIVAIELRDRYVTVEAGCTWERLHAALAPRGVRTPFWGPLSGLHSTVGGAASQGSIFLGSSRYGTVGDSVLAFELVLADGTRVATGSAAHPATPPFFRNYGPDLTGLFCNDAGALALKATVTLRLIPAHRHRDHLSAEYADAGRLLDALAAIGASGLASEAFAFDPVLRAQRMKRADLATDLATLGSVVRGSGGLLRGAREGARLVRAGRDFLAGDRFSLHLSVEADSRAELVDRMARLRALLGPGREVENSVPKVLRARPFTPPTAILGPEGERWVPVHGIVPASRARAAFTALEAYLERHAEARERLGVAVGYLVTAIAHGAILLEPVFYWPDARTVYHDQVLGEDAVSRLPRHPPAPDAARLVAELRRGCIEVLRRHGGTHFQIGRRYPYLRDLDPTLAALLRALKAELDPHGLMNPGALGLAAP